MVATMRFSRESPTSLMIHSVSDAGIRIGDETFTSAVALTASDVIADWPQKPVGELIEEDFLELLETGPEIMVVGTGAASVFPPRDLVFAMARRGVGLEVMSTGAAARTFNVLASEGRPVAAVLYPHGTSRG